jgi:hypothetical protein
VFSCPVSYFGGLCLESRFKDQLSQLKFFAVFYNSASKMLYTGSAACPAESGTSLVQSTNPLRTLQINLLTLLNIRAGGTNTRHLQAYSRRGGGVQVGTMHPLGSCKISKTNILMSPQNTCDILLCMQDLLCSVIGRIV